MRSVERVIHPAYSNHPGKATLGGYSGLFSFEVTEDIDVPAFVDALKLFRIGVSWGGHESLVVPALASLQQTPDANSIGALRRQPANRSASCRTGECRRPLGGPRPGPRKSQKMNSVQNGSSDNEER